MIKVTKCFTWFNFEGSEMWNLIKNAKDFIIMFPINLFEHLSFQVLRNLKIPMDVIKENTLL